MYNLLISYYFSILFDVLHEKFGLVIVCLVLGNGKWMLEAGYSAMDKDSCGTTGSL